MGARRAWFLVATLVVSSAPLAFAQPDPDPEVEMQPDGDEPPLPDVTPEPEPEPEDDQPPAPPAEPDPATLAAAKKLLGGGDSFLKKGDRYRKRKRTKQAIGEYERALAAYMKAYELVANPKIFFPIGTAEERLERWVDAATHYKRFLLQATDIDDKLRAVAQQRLDNVKLNIGVLVLNVTPEEAQVVIDGDPVGTTPLAEPLYLAPGDHTLLLTADGYKPLEQPLAIEAGSESERSFDLESAAVIIEAPQPPPPPPPEIPLPPRPSRIALYTAGGLTVAFIAGAATTGILAVGKHGTFADETASERRREDARVSGKNMALLTDGLILGTIVAGGVTAYYYTKVYRPRQAEYKRKLEERDNRFEKSLSRASKILVTPWVQSGAGGISITGAL
jgi:tetratricopeptide (TPR) repeat protein